MNKLIIIILLIIPIYGNSQIGHSYPYYLKTENGEFLLKSIPHRSQMYNVSGRTDVFKVSDSLLVYSIDRYFDPDGIVLNNNGTSILYANYSIFQYDIDDDFLFYYKNGLLEKSFSLDQLIVVNQEDCVYNLFYRNNNLYTWENGHRVYNDTVKPFMKNIIEDEFFSKDTIAFLATSDEELILFDLNNGDIIYRYNIENSEELLNANYLTQKFVKPKFKNPGTYKIPHLLNGKVYQDEFAKKFDFKFDNNTENKLLYKYYRLELTCLIDPNGNCIEIYSDFEDSTLNREIERYFSSLKYDTTAVPKITEKWYFYHSSYYRNPSDEIAKLERSAERKEEYSERLWRNKQDTLNDSYIPKDLNDCLIELDNILTNSVKKKFKNSDPIDYHFTLGMSLRNRWGLWSSSRLKKYFNDLGLSHPDDMSSIILESYKLYLNNKPVKIENQLKGYYLTPKPEILLPAWMKEN